MSVEDNKVAGYLTSEEAPEIVYIVVDHYFPKMRSKSGNNYIIGCRKEDIENMADMVFEEIEKDKDGQISVYLNMKKSLERMKLSKFEKLSPEMKEEIDGEFILYAVYRLLFRGKPLKISCKAPEDSKDTA